MRTVAIAFITTMILLPFIICLSICWRLFDPVGALKTHTTAISRLGGAAIVASIGLGVALNRFAGTASVWQFFLALALIWAIGFVDDLRGLPPILRLAVQVVAGMLLWYGGWRRPWSTNSITNLVGVCLVTVIFVNAFNFLDGADGQCAGVTAIIAAAYIVLPGVTLSPLGFRVAYSLLGTSLAFLLFNFPPAKIFMGDSGSTVMGFCVALLGFDFCRSKGASISGVALLFPILIAALPLLDALLAVSRRLRGRNSLLQGDRRHFYDLLMALRWSPRKVAFTTYALNVAIAGIAWLVLRCDFRNAILVCIASIGTLLILAVRLGSLKQDEMPRTNQKSGPLFSVRL